MNRLSNFGKWFSLKKFRSWLPLLIAIPVLIIYLLMARDNAPVSEARKMLNIFCDLDSVSADTLKKNGLHKPMDQTFAEAFLKFYDHFSYKILSRSGNGKTTEIKVRISNIDTQALAKDMRIEILKEDSPDSDSYIRLMDRMLSEREYELADTEGSVYMVKTDGRWSVSPDRELRQFLSGSISRYLNDPYLLSSDETLRVYLDKCSARTAEDWDDYFQTDNYFSSASDEYEKIDRAYMKDIADFFSYSIGRIDEKRSEADIEVVISSIDMNAVLQSCRERLIDFAGTMEAITNNDAATAKAASDCLLKALEEDAVSAEYKVNVHMVNDGNGWQIDDASGLSNAVLGNITEAAAQYG